MTLGLKPSFAPLLEHVPQNSSLEVAARLDRSLTRNNLQVHRSSVIENDDRSYDNPRGFENDFVESTNGEYDVDCEIDVEGIEISPALAQCQLEPESLML